MSDVPTAVALVGGAAGLTTAVIAVFNAWKTAQWKRAELASSYVRELNTNDELVFACRALDWDGGKLVIPLALRPLMASGAIVMEHWRGDLVKAMSLDTTIEEMAAEPRLQIYRTAVDSFLSWLSLVARAVERNLFGPADIRDIEYWLTRIQREDDLNGFIEGFGYQRQLDRLRRRFTQVDDLDLEGS